MCWEFYRARRNIPKSPSVGRVRSCSSLGILRAEGGKSGLGDGNARVALVDAYYLRCFLSDHFEALVAGYHFRRDIRGDCCSGTSEERFKVEPLRQPKLPFPSWDGGV